MNPYQNLLDAAEVLTQRGIAAQVEHPGNLFVDLADGSRWGFTSGLNRDDDLLEVYFYPDAQHTDNPESEGDQPPINIDGATATGERIAAEVAARILSHLAPHWLYEREPQMCSFCEEVLCPRCYDEPICCACKNERGM